MDKTKVIVEKVKQFLAGSKVELKKVTWPDAEADACLHSRRHHCGDHRVRFSGDRRFRVDQDHQAGAGLRLWL
jgi:hypothetical protein